MKELPSRNVASIVTLIFTVIISLSSFFSYSIEGTPVPVVLQNMMCVLAACILGGTQGAGSVGLFLVAGALGLPIFSNTSAGLQAFSEPTGGYILGYFFASLITGQIIGKPSVEEKTPIAKIAMGAIVGYIIIYILGIMQYINASSLDIQEALNYSVLPFLPYDGVKLIITVIISARMRPLIASYISKHSAQ